MSEPNDADARGEAGQPTRVRETRTHRAIVLRNSVGLLLFVVALSWGYDWFRQREAPAVLASYAAFRAIAEDKTVATEKLMPLCSSRLLAEQRARYGDEAPAIIRGRVWKNYQRLRGSSAARVSWFSQTATIDLRWDPVGIYQVRMRKEDGRWKMDQGPFVLHTDWDL